MGFGRIKGITVEIGGDTSKLTDALRDVNNQVKETQYQLKDVEKLLKLDPGNTELLVQRQRLLSEAVQETKTKLETLKTAAEQANRALANGEISQNQYDALQREIIATEEELKRLETQAESANTALQKIAADGTKLKELGNNVSGVGEKSAPASAAVAGLGVAAIKTAADFDSGMSKVAAVSGATGTDLEMLRDKAREMGAKTKFSATEAASAMEYMAMAGWKTEDMLGGIEGVMNLAAASGEDLATTSDIVTDALTAFGLTADDSGHFADILAAASSNANTNVAMMGETFKYAAPIAGALGFSAEDTAEAIGLMANAGIKSSQAGTSLRNILTNLTGEVTICGETLGETTIATTNADGTMRSLGEILADCRTAFAGLTETEQASNAESLVGKEAMSGFLALMNAAPADIEKLNTAISTCSDSVDGYNGAAEKMAAIMQDNLAGQLTILKSQLEELAIFFGEMIMPLLQQAVTALQNLMDWLNSMDEGTRKVILTIAAVIAAAGPALIIIGKIISAVGTIMTLLPKLHGVIGTVSTGLKALHAVMLANPITIVIAAITALVAAFLYLWNTNEEFRQFWISLWNSMKQTVSIVTNAIGNFLKSAWNTIKTTVTGAVSAVGTAVSSTWGKMKDTAVSKTSELKNNLASAFTSIKDGIAEKVPGIYTTVKDGFSRAAEYIKDLASQAYSWGADLIDGLVQGIKNGISAVTGAVKNVAQTIRSYLHFSVPDVGPLTDYESWMPDFVKGLAEGLEKSSGLLDSTMNSVAGSLVLQPQLAGIAGGQTARSNTGHGDLVGAIREAVQGLSREQSTQGDIVIPVYVGGTLLDEMIVSAEQRRSLRSGGR